MKSQSMRSPPFACSCSQHTDSGRKGQDGRKKEKAKVALSVADGGIVW
jgi:hypothetical protein